MTTQTIDKRQWQAYFDQISRSLTTSTVDIEVDSQEFGAQQEVTGVHLLGLTYDPRDDAFSILTENLEHRVAHPRQITVAINAGHLNAVEIVDGEGRRHIARFAEALQLPPPQSEARPFH